MEQKLDLIITQNWALLVMLALLFVSTLTCNIYNFRKSQRVEEDPQFGNLWDTDQIDELLKQSDKMLDAYPNRVDALYFRGKALRKIGKHQEAIYYFKRLQEIDPSFEKEATRQLADIQEVTADKSSPTDASDAGASA